MNQAEFNLRYQGTTPPGHVIDKNGDITIVRDFMVFAGRNWNDFEKFRISPSFFEIEMAGGAVFKTFIPHDWILNYLDGFNRGATSWSPEVERKIIPVEISPEIPWHVRTAFKF